MYITHGYTVSIGIGFAGNNAFTLSKEAASMAIEAIEWRIYKQSELAISAGPYGLVGRVSHTILWGSQDQLKIKFDQPSKHASVCTVKFQGAKNGVLDSPVASKTRLFQRIDSFWDALLYYSRARDVQAMRFDSYLRRQDLVANQQKVFVVRIKRSLRGSLHAHCPACERDISFDQIHMGGTHDCPGCGRIFVITDQQGKS